MQKIELLILNLLCDVKDQLRKGDQKLIDDAHLKVKPNTLAIQFSELHILDGSDKLYCPEDVDIAHR